MQEHGILVLDKPKGISSAHALSSLKRLGQKKIGHAGTLDPMATGVLLVLLGQATKLSNYLLEGGKKVYEGELLLGTVTDTWDIEGKVLEENDFSEITAKDVINEVERWLGTTSQVVPPYSAAKHKGKPLYKLAREGKEVPVKIKDIHISQAQILSLDLPYLRFKVECSSGSYIRSLAHSLGARLGCGACLTALTRHYSHPFSLEQACTLEEIKARPELLHTSIYPLNTALNWPVVSCDEELSEEIQNGKSIVYNYLCAHSNFLEVFPDSSDFNARAFFEDREKTPLALMQASYQEGEIKPVWNVLRGLWHNL